MLNVNSDGTIQLTRGDTARLEITIKNSLTEEAYDMAPDDILSFTIKKSVKDETALLPRAQPKSSKSLLMILALLALQK